MLRPLGHENSPTCLHLKQFGRFPALTVVLPRKYLLSFKGPGNLKPFLRPSQFIDTVEGFRKGNTIASSLLKVLSSEMNLAEIL
jgi:hypothetical protein